MRTVFEAVAEHLPMSALLAQEPGVADFADPGQVRSVLTSAGFEAVTATGFETMSVLGRDPADAGDFLFAAHLRSVVTGADPTAVRRAHHAVQEVLRSYESGGEIRIPAHGWLYSAVWLP
ncbi:hypothetical protein [Actinoalloteichus hymeniacidonis]|uniref:hypothetical protein n=1 Tax=Actinoalloteichus hymeniacidonis TaxID=340345 RepID=UPI0017EA1542|nr:hypothetical protein [Actinoalloteichus hymeniacidonis]MBB5906906.1 hypothetical protein [Actinoalloteichus hymeniacidonis]